MSEEAHKIITDKLNEILKILNGNGEIGMCAKVQLMWGRMNKVITSIIGISVILVGKIAWEFISKR